MNQNVRIEPGGVNGIMAAPPSKSMMQRAVTLATLANGTSEISNPSFCDDSKAALGIARALGADVEENENCVKITGGIKPQGKGNVTVNCGESGLCIRMFSPIAALFDKEITLTGNGSLLSRPVGMIEEPLRALGAECKTDNGRPPVTVRGPMKGGNTRIDASTSSQFISGLLIALPLCPEDSKILVNNLKSRPYVEMTLELLERFGINIKHDDKLSEFNISGSQNYTPIHYTIEGDWSGASFLLVAGAISGSVSVTGLRASSLQADKAVLSVLKSAGAEIIMSDDSIYVGQNKDNLHSFEFNATDCPDLFPPLVVLACNCNGTSRITGVERLRHKESDRAAVLVEEFTKMGAAIKINENSIEVTGKKLAGDLVVDPHGDHRIAMACAVAALNATSGITIRNAGCIYKSYSRFFWDLKGIGANADYIMR